MDQNQNQKENAEKKISSQEEMQNVFEQAREINPKKIEISAEEKEKIKEELRREIELMDIDPALKKEAEDKAKKIGSLALDKIFEHLLEIMEEKGGINNREAVWFAVNVAQRMNDFGILDTFHDILVRERLKEQN